MTELEYKLSSIDNLHARDIKKIDLQLYNELLIYANNIGHLPSEVLRVYQQHSNLCLTSNCVICGAQFDVYNRKGNACSKSCQSLYMHKIRPPEVSIEYRRKLKVSNDIRRESGDLSETSKRAYETRRKNRGDTDIHTLNKLIGEKTSLTAKRKKENKRQLLIDRISKILLRKSPLLILRLFYVHGFIKTYKNLINTFVSLGFKEFDQFKDKKFRYAARNGLQFIHACIECGAVCGFRNKFCSDYCRDTNKEIKTNRLEKLSVWAAIPENKEYMRNMLLERHAKLTPKERHLQRKKIYDGKSQEWIDAKSDKAIETRIKLGQILPRDNHIKTEYAAYKNTVRRITNSNKFDIPNIELRGKHTYHIDHIYPTIQGFLNKIPPELIGDIRNLRILEASKNIKKSGRIEYVPLHIQDYINAENYKNSL